MYLLPLCHKRIPSQRIRILATYQRSHLPPLRLHNFQSMPIPRAPSQLLKEGRYQFTMMNNNLPIIAYDKIRIKQRSATIPHLLTDTQTHHDASLLRRVADSADFFTIDEQRFGD